MSVDDQASSVRLGRKSTIDEFITEKSELDKNGRRDSKCCFCPRSFKGTRPDQVLLHITDECKHAPQEVKRLALDRRSNKSGSVALVAPAVKRLRSSSRASSSSNNSGHAGGIVKHTSSSDRVTDECQKRLDVKAIRAFVHAGIPFHAIEDPYFLDWLSDLRPHYVPPGEDNPHTRAMAARECCELYFLDVGCTLSSFSMAVAGKFKLDSLLGNQEAFVSKLLAEQLAKCDHVTMSLDGWTSASNQSVYAVNFMLDSGGPRIAILYDVLDFSSDQHTGEFISGMSQDVCSQFECITPLALPVQMVDMM